MERIVKDGLTPIPVYQTEIIERISELLLNENITPTLLILKDLHQGCDMVIRHKDKAMSRVLPDDCLVGIKQIKEFKKQIVPGMLAIIILEEFKITRQLYYGADKNEFLLKSSDPEFFPDMNVSVDDVKELWTIKSWNLPVKAENLMY